MSLALKVLQINFEWENNYKKVADKYKFWRFTTSSRPFCDLSKEKTMRETFSYMGHSSSMKQKNSQPVSQKVHFETFLFCSGCELYKTWFKCILEKVKPNVFNIF